MKVIFKDTLKIRDVAFGYAVNYLFPRNLAVLATPQKIKELEMEKAKREQIQQLKDKENDLLAKKLDNQKIILKIKSGVKKTFGSITKKDILDNLSAGSQKIEVILEKPIKKIGKYQIELKIGKHKATINLEVKKE